MVGFLDGKGNGGIEVVGFGGPGAFSLFFSSSLRALLCTHTHTHTLVSPDSREFTPPFFIGKLSPNPSNPLPWKYITRSHRL